MDLVVQTYAIFLVTLGWHQTVPKKYHPLSGLLKPKPYAFGLLSERNSATKQPCVLLACKSEEARAKKPSAFCSLRLSVFSPSAEATYLLLTYGRTPW